MGYPAPSDAAKFRQICPSRLDAFDNLVHGLRAWTGMAGVSKETLSSIVLILDELFSNIVIHGYQWDGSGSIEVEALGGPAEIVVTLTDQAPPFNPLTIPEPDTKLPMAIRPEGGLGLLLVRRTADRLQYRLTTNAAGEISNQISFAQAIKPSATVG